MRTIALEEHFWTAELAAAPGTGPLARPDGARLDAQLRDLGPDRIAGMDAAGIDVQVLSHVQPAAQGLPGDTGITAARTANEALAAAIARRPDRLAGFATLPTGEPEKAAAELERAVGSLGLVGGMVHSTLGTNGAFLDHERFEPVLATFEDLDVPLYLHPASAPKNVADVLFGGLRPAVAARLSTNAWGWHAEAGLHALRLVASGAFERHPGLKLIVGHCGEMLPFMLARVDEMLPPEVTGLPHRPSTYLRRNVWVTTSGMFSLPPVLCSIAVMGVDRVLFSVDYPFAANMAGRELLDALSLSPADKAKVAGENAASLLRLAIAAPPQRPRSRALPGVRCNRSQIEARHVGGPGMTKSNVADAGEGTPASGRPWGAFIGGSWAGSSGTGDAFIVDEPATGKPLAAVAASDAATTAAAVADSRRAYEQDWRRTTPRERSAYLRAAAEVIRDHAEEIAELEAREVGKPRRDALRFDVSYCSAAFDYYGGLAETLHGEVIDSGPIEARVKYEPYGVVAAILPFNWPPLHFSKKTAPAIAAGNTVVIKPGEQAPLAVLRLVELVNQVLPPGVVNAVTGPAAGPALTANPVVERITFTGATSTGRAVLRAAAENLTYATMELGGKNALIVLDDADMDTAVSVAIEGMFYNQGEACTSTARLLVHNSRHDEFLARFCAAAESLVVGDGLDPRTDIGAMVDSKQRERVLGYLRRGLEEGARLAAQGSLPADPRLAGGFFVPPAVLADVTPGMAVAQEEIFGPVACVMRYDTEDEAVAIANGTAYGLTCALITEDHFRASRLADRLEAGMVFVNNYMRRAFLGTPFGGVKGSGFGRENGADTLREFVRAKNIRFPSGRQPVPGWPPRD